MLLCVGLGGLGGLAHASPTPTAWPISSARATFDIPGQPAVERDVALPHRWDHDFARKDGRATYHLRLPSRPQEPAYALYLPRVGNQLEVRLDGQLIFRHGKLGDASTDAAKAPLLIQLPTLVHTGAETLTITVTAQSGRWGGLTQPWVGPADTVREMYLTHYRWRQWGALAVVAAMALAAVMAVGLWFLQREPVYASFALAGMWGAARFVDRVIEEPPLPWPWWGGLMASALSLHVLWMTRFSLQLLALDTPRWRAVLRVSMVLQVALAFTAFLSHRPVLWTIALVLLGPPTWLALTQTLVSAWHQRSREAMGLTVAGGLAVGAGLRDFLVVRLSGDGAGTFSILPHTTMAFVLLMTWVMLDRFARQGRQLRALNASLDRQVREKERELQASYEALRSESEQRAALSERQRIMRDIHDGVGAHLVGLVNLLRKDHVPTHMLREHANTALDELRMAVDAMHNTEGDLPTLLASMRYRLQDRFNACGITLDWHMDDPLPDVHLTPEQLLQVQRIVLESFTNILKHAGASRIWARVGNNTTHGLHLLIDDNGVGMATAAITSLGQGLHNMRQRAQAVDAQLDILPSPHGGVRVSLQLQRLNGPRNGPASPESPGPATA